MYIALDLLTYFTKNYHQGNAIQSTAARPDGSPGHCIGDPDNSQYFVSGTSAAAPVVSGSIALIQQYLQDGFYPSGEANEDDAILNPSAALLKAIILNGALEMSNHKLDNQLLSYDNASLPAKSRTQTLTAGLFHDNKLTVLFSFVFLLFFVVSCFLLFVGVGSLAGQLAPCKGNQ